MRLICATLLLVGSLEAQIPEGMEGAFQPHPEGREAISRLYSPFCPGFMLEVCTAQQSIMLRDSIHALAYQGWTANELIGWMLSNHGSEYLAVPGRSGWGVWAWVLPPLGLLGGIAGMLLALRKFRPTGREDDSPGDPEAVAINVSGEEEARLRSALREIELSEDPSL